jgi:hypothetical protein
MAEVKELQIAQLVLSGEDDADSWVIPDGETWRIEIFGAGVPSSSQATAQLIWDFGGAGETIKWTIQHDELNMPPKLIFDFTGDGVKKLALCLSNGCTADYNMAAYARLEKISG